jgi:hypothetical protein
MTTRSLVALGLAASISTLGTAAGAEPQQNAPNGSINAPVTEPPPADVPLLRTIPKAQISMDGGVGVIGYIGGAAGLGPAWNVRVTGDLNPRFALEGNYVGAANQRSDGTGTLGYTSLDGDVRFNILRADQAPVEPFVTAGLGWAAFIGPGGTAGSLVVPLNVGVERLLTEHIKIGARFALRPALFADLGHPYDRNPPGGGTWALIANVGGYF